MILASEIAELVRASLDAEGSDYYRNDRDIIPAINLSIDRLSSIIDSVFADKKVSEEVFSDLAKVDIYQINQFGRFSVDFSNVWTVLGIFPDPVIYPSNPLMLQAGQPNISDSFIRQDIAYVSSKKIAKRLTQEEWNKNSGNPFAAGYTGTQMSDINNYAYLSPVDYSSSVGSSKYTAIREIEVRPNTFSFNKFIALSYARPCPKISDISDSILFPRKAEIVIYNLVLQYISIKQGDQTTVYSVSEKDRMDIIKAFS